MSMHYISMDRASKFDVTITPDRRNPELPCLNIKAFDSVVLTLTKEQLAAIGKAIDAETGGAPF